jgi:hypothetical protein
VASSSKEHQEAPPWSRPGFEWCLVGLVIVALVFVFGQQVQMLQGRAELAAVRSTLGALRVAFALDHLKQATTPHQGDRDFAQRNPFLLLARLPANYAGEVRHDATAARTPGSWVFDIDCDCAGYTPIDGQWLQSPSGSPMMWFRVSMRPAPFQLDADEAYIWQDQPVK